jgi:hypothetical protein
MGSRRFDRIEDEYFDILWALRVDARASGQNTECSTVTRVTRLQLGLYPGTPSITIHVRTGPLAATRPRARSRYRARAAERAKISAMITVSSAVSGTDDICPARSGSHGVVGRADRPAVFPSPEEPPSFLRTRPRSVRPRPRRPSCHMGSSSEQKFFAIDPGELGSTRARPRSGGHLITHQSSFTAINKVRDHM